MSTINFNFFRFSWKFIFIGQFLFCYHSSIMLLSSCLLFYMCCFLIRLFAGWRYAGRIFNAVSAEGRRSQSSVARTPSLCAPTPLGTEGVLRCCVCYVVDFCLYASVFRMWNVVLIWFLDSSIFMAVRCADLRSGSGILRYL